MRSVSAAEDSLRDGLCAWLECGEAPPTPEQQVTAADVWATLTEPGAEGLDLSLLAAGLSEALSAEERDVLLAKPGGSLEMQAAEDFIASAVDPLPPRMRAVAQALLGAGSNVVSLRAREPLGVQPQTFRLRAAATAGQDHAVLCKSDSGIWTLEVFVARRPDGGEDASLLLSVDPDYWATYEGLRARVFVTIDGAERVLADADVRNGELYEDISLAGLDLYARDAINVVFAPAPDGAAQ